jgi:hypothetical protein
MHIQVQEAIVKAIQIARFIELSCDAVTMINNGSWICIHAYVVQSWVRIPITSKWIGWVAIILLNL